MTPIEVYDPASIAVSVASAIALRPERDMIGYLMVTASHILVSLLV